MNARTLSESVASLWGAACEHDSIDPTSRFVVFSATNPYAAGYNSAMGRLLELRHKSVTVTDECRNNAATLRRMGRRYGR